MYKSVKQEFEFRAGPIFSNVVLADEINRTTPRTQSALLEAMSEDHVSVDDESHKLPDPFLVIAPTQDAPIAEDDLVYVHYSTSRTFSLLVNDHDIDGDALTVYSYVEDLPGTLTFDTETQMFTYVPAIGENGISTFTYTISDGHDTDTAIAELDVVSEMHNPVITSINSQYVNEDGTISGIAFSVSDEDVGDTATITRITSYNVCYTKLLR